MRRQLQCSFAGAPAAGFVLDNGGKWTNAAGYARVVLPDAE
jgi:hypothetical protein